MSRECAMPASARLGRNVDGRLAADDAHLPALRVSAAFATRAAPDSCRDGGGSRARPLLGGAAAAVAQRSWRCSGE